MSVVDWIVWGIFLTFFGGIIVLPILYILCLFAYAATVGSWEWAVKTAKGIWFELTPLLPESWTTEGRKKEWARAYLYALYVESMNGPRSFRLYNSEIVFRVITPKVSILPGREKLVFQWLKRGEPACIHRRDMWKGKDPGGFMGDVIHALNQKFAVSTYTQEDMHST